MLKSCQNKGDRPRPPTDFDSSRVLPFSGAAQRRERAACAEGAPSRPILRGAVYGVRACVSGGCWRAATASRPRAGPTPAKSLHRSIGQNRDRFNVTRQCRTATVEAVGDSYLDEEPTRTLRLRTVACRSVRRRDWITREGLQPLTRPHLGQMPSRDL
ncbi:hypothetical protein EVAR_24146_1 [Eumeta japonica]|uniref:Uncharacterized protein n=1 Tax=Eumeta variegata TaxID=151549 RepID=A0A4C1YRZ8_EUMVA|nr:hypothetical protein EVAR_24146_1 [Eumeta japonica]